MAVLLDTSVGDLVVDLFTDECPITTKNFLKLCKIKYYNNCLFHNVQKDFIAQTGDPTGTGKGGDSIYKFLYGDQAKYFDNELSKKLRHRKKGTVSMAGEDANASQFFVTLRDGLDYLDDRHTVFGEISEGLEHLDLLNDTFVDDAGRPLKNIRIKHTVILDDPFDDPPGLADLIPDKSPELKPAEGEPVRVEYDWKPEDDSGRDADEIEKELRKKASCVSDSTYPRLQEAKSRAVVLEMIGDLPEADVLPPENVLFVCKLNPVTEEEDLEIIFSRFGKIVSCDIIRDHKTGDSLCYAFIGFEQKEMAEGAYFKMDNVLIDDRRIHVDFSQSVSKLWNRFKKVGPKDEADDETRAASKFEIKGQGGQVGGKAYDLVFDTPATAEGTNGNSHSKRPPPEDARRARGAEHPHADKRSKRDDDRVQDRDRDRDLDRDRDRGRDRDRDREQDKDRGRERDGGKEEHRERRAERPRDKDTDRSRDRDRSGDRRDADRDRSGDRDRHRHRDRDGDRSRGRDRARDRAR
eukprot:jgi/Chlat1/2709/Chrsp180S08755